MTPTTLDFGDSNTELSLFITNSSNSPVSYGLSGMPPWATPSSAGGRLAARTDTISILADRSGLATGPYEAQLAVNSDAGAQVIVFLRLSVAELPTFGTAEIEPNNSRSQSNAARVNEPITGVVGATGDDEDWFGLENGLAGVARIAIQNTTTQGSGRLGWYGVQPRFGSSVFYFGRGIRASDAFGGPGTSETSPPFTIDADDVHFGIRRGSGGSAHYRATAVFEPLPFQDSHEPARANGLDTLQLSTSRRATVGYDGDTEDNFRIAVSETTLYGIRLGNAHTAPVDNGNIRFAFRNPRGGLLAAGTLGPGEVWESADIQGGTGTYRMEIDAPGFDQIGAPYQLDVARR